MGKTKNIDKKLDTEWSRIIRSRGKCERCNNPDTLAGSHIMPRTHKTTRWLLLNGFCLCYRCHIHWWHKNPIEAFEWAEKMLGKDVIKNLKFMAHTPYKAKVGEKEALLAELKLL